MSKFSYNHYKGNIEDMSHDDSDSDSDCSAASTETPPFVIDVSDIRDLTDNNFFGQPEFNVKMNNIEFKTYSSFEVFLRNNIEFNPKIQMFYFVLEHNNHKEIPYFRKYNKLFSYIHFKFNLQKYLS